VRWLPRLTVVAAVVVTGLSAGPSVYAAPGAGRGVQPFRGLGTWVDVYDFSPDFVTGHRRPAITTASVDRMASEGITTLYVQAANARQSVTRPLVSPALIGGLLTRAHADGMQVVGWYAPAFADPAADLRRLLAMRDFRWAGQRFDGLAVDIEVTSGVRDAARRSQVLVDLSRRLRSATTAPLGAIVMAPVVLDVVNPRFWPQFPWRGIAPYYDAWLPMDYWTDRTVSSGFRDAYRYTSDNITRLRADVGQPGAVVHAIGGVGGMSSEAQYLRFAAAARGRGAVGLSVYDYRATGPAVWPLLRRR
jgi:hypothetical protein